MMKTKSITLIAIACLIATVVVLKRGSAPSTRRDSDEAVTALSNIKPKLTTWSAQAENTAAEALPLTEANPAPAPDIAPASDPQTPAKPAMDRLGSHPDTV